MPISAEDSPERFGATILQSMLRRFSLPR